MRFMDIHTGMHGIDQEQLMAAHKQDVDIEATENVHFLHAWADPASGRVFCLSEAPSKEAVQRIHEEAGHPADEIYELPLEVE